MASIASQLQVIKSALKSAPEPTRRPISRPSILFDPKEAADIDLRAILPISLSGLESLAGLDERFGQYRDTLFSETSLELDREKMVPTENERLDKSIASYLRLLAGHLQLPAALKTLEYLIRRYLVHVYNVDELLLCALPYHDTHAFVRIVQLINLGNSKWVFLEGVKSSGAPPPRSVLVQQCIRDKALLETFCNYATPTKEFQHSRPVICFCTAVIVECLGAIPKLDTDVVQRVLGFVFDGLNPAMRGDRDHKAGALMVVGLLATRATLAPKLVQNLIYSVARVACRDAMELVDLPWLRVTMMAIISLVQSQSVHVIPKKPLMILGKIRDFAGVLSELSNEFNIQRFMSLYVESLVQYSTSDDSCCTSLINTIEALPMKNYIEKIVSRVLGYCVKASKATDNSSIHDIGRWAKKILSAIEKHYTLELRAAIRKFLENSEINLRKEEIISETLCSMFDGSTGVPTEISDSNLWFNLEHPKAVVRQSALSKIAASGIFKNSTTNPQKFINMQDAIIRGLCDDDLSVVQAALSVDGLAAVASPDSLLKAYDHVLSKCIAIFHKGASKTSRACDVAVSCLEQMVLEFQSHHRDQLKNIATIIFPLLLVHPKTTRVNLKALELVKKIQWPFYIQSSLVYDQIFSDEMKNMDVEHAASINMKNIRAFAEVFAANPNEHMQWLAGCGEHNGLSRSLFLLIILQAILVPNEVLHNLENLCQSCWSVLKNEWCHIQPSDDCVNEEISIDKLEKCGMELVKHIFNSDTEALNARILVCTFWGLLRVHSCTMEQNTSVSNSGRISMLDDLFLFFITSSPQNVFKKHLQFLLVNCSPAPFQFLSKYFTEEGFPVGVQGESLLLFASICSLCALSEHSNLDENLCLQLLVGFPSLFVPLAHENKDIRSSAINCIEGLCLVWQCFNMSLSRNGSNNKLPQCVSSPTFGVFLESLVSQKKMISSDARFLSAYISSMLSSHQDILVPENLHERFDQPMKDAILTFILRSALKFPPHGKLMVLSLLKGVGGTIFCVEDVKALLLELLDRRSQYHFGHGGVQQKLSTHEVEILCLLLEVLFSESDLANISVDVFGTLVKALRVDDLSPDDPAVVRPCVTVLQTLQPGFFHALPANIQDKVFSSLVSLFRTENVEIRNATRDALLQINVNGSVVVRLVEFILAQGDTIASSKRVKREKDLKHDSFDSFKDLFWEKPTTSIIISLLDILLLKKDIYQRACLLQPLFHVLSKLLSNQWILRLIGQEKKQNVALSEIPESASGVVYQVQQSTLLVLKDIIDTLQPGPNQDELFSRENIHLLMDFARSTEDVSTRNHVLLLIASIARVSPQLISESIVDLFVVIGQSAVKQEDSHSQCVLEDVLSILVPCWLSRTTSIGKLLQIFIKALPDVAEHRRLTLMVYLLRTLGEARLSSVMMQLFRSLVQRVLGSSTKCRGNQCVLPSLTSMTKEWEYELAVKISDQYSYKIWFPCLFKLLQEIRVHDEQALFCELPLAIQFILFKLQGTELIFELESAQSADSLQGTLGALMEEVVLCLVSVRSKELGVTADVLKEFKDCANTVLKIIAEWMSASTYFRGITQLLGHANGLVKRKALGILCETVRGNSLVPKKHKETRKSEHNPRTIPLEVDNSTAPSFNDLCLKIVELIDNTADDSDTPVRIAAISSLEILAKEYPSDNLVYSTCLTSIVNHVGSGNLATSSGLIRAAGSLINVLGSKALPQLPVIMRYMLERSHVFSHCPSQKSVRGSTESVDGLATQGLNILLSILTTMEVIVEKLGGFLNPYLEEILDLVVLHPECALQLDAKIDAKAANVRKLLTEKIPVRLMLAPLLKLYSNATKCGEASLSLNFQMLASLIGTMDRSSIGTYHAKIFEHCLMALDLCCQSADSVKNLNIAEQSIINAMIVLTMKLTETMFRPLFLHGLEWADSEVEFSQSTSKVSSDRVIAFYKLVNKLAEQHRSLFVPYFKYLLEGCVRYLTRDRCVGLIGSKQKRKKAKLGDARIEHKDKLLALKQWYLRALILKSLNKCFLYDTDQKILDSSNFQALLKPIVSQFVMEPPESLESFSDAPSVEEVDETLVSCLGQMAVTARSDVLWKPLNHEVLMQTRNDKVRPKMLGLKVVRYLVQHLKEEYVVLLPETIPFLSELLEDAELPVKTLAQEVLKEMETLSGESLRQYL